MSKPVAWIEGERPPVSGLGSQKPVLAVQNEAESRPGLWIIFVSADQYAALGFGFGSSAEIAQCQGKTVSCGPLGGR